MEEHALDSSHPPLDLIKSLGDMLIGSNISKIYWLLLLAKRNRHKLITNLFMDASIRIAKNNILWIYRFLYFDCSTIFVDTFRWDIMKLESE